MDELAEAVRENWAYIMSECLCDKLVLNGEVIGTKEHLQKVLAIEKELAQPSGDFSGVEVLGDYIDRLRTVQARF